MAKNLEKLLAEARKAYQKKDKRKGARLVDQILQQDFYYMPAWELLHQLNAPKQPFDQFQRSFTEIHYPDKLPELLAPSQKAAPDQPAQKRPARAGAPAAAPPAKKPSFFARLFGFFKRSPKTGPAANIPGGPKLPPIHRPAPQHPASHSPQPAAAEEPATSDAPVAAAPAPEIASPATSKPEPPSQSVQPSLIPASGLGRVQASTATTSGAAGDKIRILVVDDISQTRSNVIRALRFQDGFEVIGSATDGEQGIQMARDLEPDVIIMDVNMPGMDGIAATGLIKRELPTTEIIIMTVQDDVDYMRGAMAAGARDFLAKPPMVDELIQAVKRAGGFALEAKAALKQVEEKVVTFVPTIQGKVITIYSPRGGAGCTTLAVNLAAALHGEATPVVVVDGNLQFGDVSVFLNVQSRYTIFDLAPRSEELDPDIIDEVLAKHASGLHVLAPPRPEQAETINSLQFAQILKFLRGLYPYVIVDTARRLTDVTLAALDSCDLTIVVATQEIPAIARMRQFLDLSPALGLDSSNTMMVINGYSTSIGIPPDKIGQVLKQKVAAVIPADRATAIPAMNRGNPFILQAETNSRPIAQAIQELKGLVLQRLEQLEKGGVEDEDKKEDKKPAKR